MATPGRTHIPWQNQNSQVQELLNYIGFLEAKLEYLQRHHEQCDVWNNVGQDQLNAMSYIPPDLSESRSESSLAIDPQLDAIQPFPAVISQADPQAQAIAKGNPRWKRIIDLMLAGWDNPQSMLTKRSLLGLETVQGNNFALITVLGSSRHSSPSIHPTSIVNTSNAAGALKSKEEALVEAARRYATETKVSAASTGLLVPIHHFRDLVFASLCVVLEVQGIPVSTINDLMRICATTSGAANLYRLRRGALWLNRIIRNMRRNGWGHYATELFLLSGKPVSQYGLLWEACAHSFPYLTEKLELIKETVIMPPFEAERTPFFIPLILKELVGESLSLKELCISLDYEEMPNESGAMEED